jgi:hypothetical protein
VSLCVTCAASHAQSQLGCENQFAKPKSSLQPIALYVSVANTGKVYFTNGRVLIGSGRQIIVLVEHSKLLVFSGGNYASFDKQTVQRTKIAIGTGCAEAAAVGSNQTQCVPHAIEKYSPGLGGAVEE